MVPSLYVHSVFLANTTKKKHATFKDIVSIMQNPYYGFCEAL